MNNKTNFVHYLYTFFTVVSHKSKVESREWAGEQTLARDSVEDERYISAVLSFSGKYLFFYVAECFWGLFYVFNCKV